MKPWYRMREDSEWLPYTFVRELPGRFRKKNTDHQAGEGFRPCCSCVEWPGYLQLRWYPPLTEKFVYLVLRTSLYEGLKG